MAIKNIFLTLSFVLILCPTARADLSTLGLFVEPALTYEIGETTVDYPSPLTTSTGNANGFGLGVKFGFHISDAVFLAFDGRYSFPKYTDSSVNYDAKSVSTNWGPVIGVQMPNIGLRLWGTLILGGELDPEKSGSYDVAFKEASGFRVGVGFRISVVSLNLEYQEMKLSEAILEQLGPFSPGSSFDNVHLEGKSWIASVSFPLEL